MRIATVTAIALLIATLASCTYLTRYLEDGRNFNLYTTPQQRIDIGGGRHIHIVCMGVGSPTVILSAGGNDWSAGWRLVQPEIARTTKVCSWDRAGNGFSSGSPDPQDIVHTEDDLERALAAAGLTGPLVMVGHSHGAFQTLLFADRHPDRVAAMVLVDPSTPDQGELSRRAAPQFAAFAEKSNAQSMDRTRACARAQKHAGGVPAPECAGVLLRYPEPLRTNLLTAAANEPLYWDAYMSLWESMERSYKLAINEKRDYGAMPLIVLAAGVVRYPALPADAERELPVIRAARVARLEALAQLSSQGVLETVPDSPHVIQMWKPKVVIKAVERAIDAASLSVASPHG
jgi:pimeloyl-ACP methyl ester carboxylesterase